MNSEKFKEKFIRFIMKKWTCPTVCGICILLIFAMSANSFAKYYTRIQAERAASVAIFGSDIKNDEDLWTKPAVAKDGFNGLYTVPVVEPKPDFSEGCARVYLGESPDNYEEEKKVLPYIVLNDAVANQSYSFNVTNCANGKVCEVALSYTLTIEFPDEMPKGVTWTLQKTNADGSNATAINDLTYETLNYGEKSYYKLGRRFSSSVFTFDAGVEEIDTYIIKFSGSNVVYDATDKFYDDMKVTITTTQVTK